MFDFKKSISGLIELKFSGKTPNEVLYAPIYFWGVYFLFKGVVSVLGVAYPAGFGSLKAITKCFWSRKVGHINGLFVLEVESGGCIFTCRKDQTNGRKTSTVYSLLKASHPAMAMNRRDHDQRAEHRHYIATTAA